MKIEVGYVHYFPGGCVVICAPCHRKQPCTDDTCERVDDFEGAEYECSMQNCDNVITSIKQ